MARGFSWTWGGLGGGGRVGGALLGLSLSHLFGISTPATPNIRSVGTLVHIMHVPPFRCTPHPSTPPDEAPVHVPPAPAQALARNTSVTSLSLAGNQVRRTVV
jgi:hypothetical protein